MVNTNLLRAKVVEKGLSIEEFAKLVGVSYQTLYRWLKHPESMTVGNVKAMSDALNLTKESFTAIFYPNFVA